MNIGFIGLGVMGSSMARNLMKHGYHVLGYTRTKSKAEALIKDGLDYQENRVSLAKKSDVIITMVGYPSDVEETYFGESGLINHVKEGTYLIDMTTSSPMLAQKIYDEGQKKGLHVLDAPVSGGDSGAKAGTLAIMVGGDEADFESMKDVLSCMGNSVIYEGTIGSGQHTKMANQIAIAGALSGVAEAIRYAQEAGLDVEKMLDTISGGAASSWQLVNLGPKMIHKDYAPGFYMKHFIKDMKIADEEAKERGLTLDILETVLSHSSSLKEHEDDGTQSIIEYYKENS